MQSIQTAFSRVFVGVALILPSRLCALFCNSTLCAALLGCADLEPVYDSRGNRLEDDHRAIALKALDDTWWDRAKVLDLGNAVAFFHGHCINGDVSTATPKRSVPHREVQFAPNRVTVDASRGMSTSSNWSGCVRGEIVVVKHGTVMVGSDLNVRNGVLQFSSWGGSVIHFQFDPLNGRGAMKYLTRADVKAELRKIAFGSRDN